MKCNKRVKEHISVAFIKIPFFKALLIDALLCMYDTSQCAIVFLCVMNQTEILDYFLQHQFVGSKEN